MAAFTNNMRLLSKSNVIALCRLVKQTCLKSLNIEPYVGLSVCALAVNRPNPSCRCLTTGSFGSKRPETLKTKITSDTIYTTLARRKSDALSSPNAPTVGDESTTSKDGAKEKKWYQSTTAKVLGVVMGLFGASSCVYLLYLQGSPARDDDGTEVKDEFTGKFFENFYRTKKRIVEPSRTQLLPEPLQAPYYQPPYTLVIEMNGILLHPDWKYETGWRYQKRPGVDYFLSKVAPPFYEVVIFTAEPGMNADPLVNTLDPHGTVMYRLYRDSTRYHNGHHVKDLSYLNRDLSKVIILDWNELSYQFHPRNGLKLKKWEGKEEEYTLQDLANFLQVIASSNVEDVRTVIDYYNQFDDPIGAFKENQRKLLEEQQRQAQLASADKNKVSPGFGWLRK